MKKSIDHSLDDRMHVVELVRAGCDLLCPRWGRPYEQARALSGLGAWRQVGHRKAAHIGQATSTTKGPLMRKRQLLVAAAMTGALGVGGMAALVLGAPGVSSAQTATTTPSTDPPTTAAQAPGQAPGPSGGQAHDCPNMGRSPGTAPGASSGSTGANNTGFHRGGSQFGTL